MSFRGLLALSLAMSPWVACRLPDTTQREWIKALEDLEGRQASDTAQNADHHYATYGACQWSKILSAGVFDIYLTLIDNMDHLEEYFGPKIHREIPFLIVDRIGTCCLIKEGHLAKAPFSHGSQYHDFLEFPARHGWRLDPDTYRLENARDPECCYETDEFIQAWLFFCLLTVVVRTDEPLIRMCDLVRKSPPNGGVGPANYTITTKTLKPRITEWHNWLKDNPSQAKFRLLQTDLILEFARQVLRGNLDQSNLKFQHPEVLLSVMVLGETLAAVKKSILREMGERILGWESDDLNGWGYPPCAMKANSDTCGYTKKALERQIGPNATLLLAAAEHFEWHEGADYGCNDKECKYVKASTLLPASVPSEGATALDANPAHDNYVPRCMCKKDQRCKLIGPKMKDVHAILRMGNDSFPVFEVQTKGEEVIVIVKDWVQHRRESAFATVSHVWSQGLGNPESNRIHECQLRFINNMLEGISSSMSISDPMSPKCNSFWLDTFAIPVDDKAETIPPDLEELRHQSIRHIYDVFNSSCHSLVIDVDLYTDKHSDFVRFNLTAAIKLLTSTWMRRLWTLQEAFLSKKMCFPQQTSNDRTPTGYPGRGFDHFIRELETSQNPQQPDILEVALAEVLKRHLFENLMGHGREARLSTGNPVDGNGSRLISSAWRSARWRDTSHREDETIILSTLLNLDFRETSLDGSVRRNDPQAAEELRTEMMKDFLRLLSKHYAGSIPAGIIFLPSKRLKLPGFGWAPATWASGHNEDYPYPLSRMEHSTELIPEGLLVRYPGIILHYEELETVMVGEGFQFPVDRELNEWYRVKLINEGMLPMISQIKESQTRKDFNRMLAVIISRPRPKERLPEIGLLVEIYHSSWRQHERQGRQEIINHSRILSRIHIRRLGSVSWKEHRNQVIGELTRDDQLWSVDSFESNKMRLEKLKTKRRDRRANGGKAKSLSTSRQGLINTAASAPGTPPTKPVYPPHVEDDGNGSQNVLDLMKQKICDKWPSITFPGSL